VGEHIVRAATADHVFGLMFGDLRRLSVPEHDPAVDVGDVDADIEIVCDLAKDRQVQREQFWHDWLSNQNSPDQDRICIALSPTRHLGLYHAV